MVASITNDTDPDGKTKIVTKLRIKLSYRNVADIMEVKVDDGAEANILPLHTFRSMFPHKLDEIALFRSFGLRQILNLPLGFFGYVSELTHGVGSVCFTIIP